MAAESSGKKNANTFIDPLENFEPKAYDDPLEQALAEEAVIAIQHEPYVTIPSNTLIGKAVETLAGLSVACLLVEDDGALVGIVSDRDILEQVAIEYESIKDKPVSSIMTTDPVFVYENDSSAAALCVMADSGFRHVPVLNSQHKIVGIVSPQRVTGFLQRHFPK